MSDGLNEKLLDSSRYADSKLENFVDAFEDIKCEDIEQKIAMPLRDSFDTDITRSKEWRIKMLKDVLLLLEEGEGELLSALDADLKKNAVEGYNFEISPCKMEVVHMLNHLEEYIKPQKKDNNVLNVPAYSTIEYEPKGVVLIISAWNYPIQLSFLPAIGAIAAGNCVVLKPGNFSPTVSHVLAKLCSQYLDKRYFRVIEGNKDTSQALLKIRWDHVFFTGSPFVGKIVAKAAAEHLTPFTLELGGKSPCVLDESCNLRHAVDRYCWGLLANCGQTCVKPDFVLVQDSIADKFIEMIKETMAKQFGPDFRESQFYGRIINHNAYDRLSRISEENKEHRVFGGDCDRDSKFIAPAIFEFKDLKTFSNSTLMQDELFGPFAPIYRFSDFSEVIKIIRQLPTGKPLAAYLFSQNRTNINEFKSKVSSGGMCINDVLMHAANENLPFGGVGSSGQGSYHGEHSIITFSHSKAILEKVPFFDDNFLARPLLNLRFPPYSSFASSTLRTLTNAHIQPYLGKINAVPGLVKNVAKITILGAAFYYLGFRVTKQ